MCYTIINFECFKGEKEIKRRKYEFAQELYAGETNEQNFKAFAFHGIIEEICDNKVFDFFNFLSQFKTNYIAMSNVFFQEIIRRNNSSVMDLEIVGLEIPRIQKILQAHCDLHKCLQNEEVDSVDLSGSFLSERDGFFILKKLNGNRNLRTLNLRGNDINAKKYTEIFCKKVFDNDLAKILIDEEGFFKNYLKLYFAIMMNKNSVDPNYLKPMHKRLVINVLRFFPKQALEIFVDFSDNFGKGNVGIFYMLSRFEWIELLQKFYRAYNPIEVRKLNLEQLNENTIKFFDDLLLLNQEGKGPSFSFWMNQIAKFTKHPVHTVKKIFLASGGRLNFCSFTIFHRDIQPGLVVKYKTLEDYVYDCIFIQLLDHKLYGLLSKHVENFGLPNLVCMRKENCLPKGLNNVLMSLLVSNDVDAYSLFDAFLLRENIETEYNVEKEKWAILRKSKVLLSRGMVDKNGREEFIFSDLTSQKHRNDDNGSEQLGKSSSQSLDASVDNECQNVNSTDQSLDIPVGNECQDVNSTDQSLDISVRNECQDVANIVEERSKNQPLLNNDNHYSNDQKRDTKRTKRTKRTKKTKHRK